ncbi:MAG: CinA family protein [Candidatus Omnitrophica bacterium]|nr:CinA family protein [Candidatus Omnitrophota bacterium]MDD5237804.1 CinA family protein [Candidatus Omnitrophota bacterium]
MAQHIVRQIHISLIKNRKSIAVAESCTGGILSGLLTQIGASSQYFILGIVAYSNKAKEIILKIPPSIIKKYGAVSKTTARLMAQNIRRIANVDFGIGITGIAGPKGASPGKPVGTVFVAIDSKKRKICKRFVFKGSRVLIRKKAALKAIELLKKAF